jgi:hypothetical protein
MLEAGLLVIGALASYRITRLVTTDKITEPIFEPLRQWFEDRWIRKHYPEYVPDAVRASDEWQSKLAFLLSCAWCLGFWVSGMVTVILSVAYGLNYPILTWLAMSTVVGFLGNIDSE